MIRGGNFNNNAANLLAPNRNNDNPTDHNNNIGFRCAKTVVLPARQDAQGRAASTDSASAAIHSPPRSSVGSRVPRDPEQCPRRAPRVPRFPSRLYPFAGTRPGAGLFANKGKPRKLRFAERSRVPVTCVGEPGPNPRDDLARIEGTRLEEGAVERHSPPEPPDILGP